MTERPPLRRVYTISTAAGLLGREPGVLRRQAKRGRGHWARGPGENGNPLRDWLIDADHVDSQSGASSSESVWIAAEVDDESPQEENRGVSRTEVSADQSGHLLSRYRDHLDLLTAQVSVERDARLDAERRFLKKERDDALRQLEALQRVFLAASRELGGDVPAQLA